MDFTDLPEAVEEVLHSIVSRLPETSYERTPSGLRWRVRKRTFAHALALSEDSGLVVVMTFRSSSPEREALLAGGHPFFEPGWGTNVAGMVLDDGVDWGEVEELLTESYCILAPKKLVRLVDRPPFSPPPSPG